MLYFAVESADSPLLSQATFVTWGISNLINNYEEFALVNFQMFLTGIKQLGLSRHFYMFLYTSKYRYHCVPFNLLRQKGT